MVGSNDMRDFRRMEIESSVTLKSLDTGSEYIGFATSLSASGILIECDRQLTVGDQFEIKLGPEEIEEAEATEEIIGSSLHAIVEIQRVGNSGKVKPYELACSITEVKPCFNF